MKPTLESGINVGVCLLIFEKNGGISFWKITAMPWLMLKFLEGGATFIQGGTSIPD